jgi:hypothetical protein
MLRPLSDANSLSLRLAHSFQNTSSQKNVKYTHVSMDGASRGKFCIPPEKNGEFLERVGRDLLSNRAIYFCEMATPISALFMDLDFGGSSINDLPNLNEIVDSVIPVIKDRITNFFPLVRPDTPEWNKLFTYIAVGGKPGLKNPTVPDKFGVGIHLHFPFINVSLEEMKPIRHDVVLYLQSEFPNYQWASIIDERVYITGRSLRMVGNRKAQKCGSCKQAMAAHKKTYKTNSQTRATLGPACTVCDNLRHIDLGDNRVYRFLTTNSTDEKFKKDLENRIDVLVEKCSIRRVFETSATEGFTLPEGCPLPWTYKIKVQLTEQQYENHRKKAENFKPSTHVKSFFTKNERLDQNIDADVFYYVTQLIQNFLPVYSRLIPTQIARDQQNGIMMILVDGENNRYCLNKMPDGVRGKRGGHHSTAEIYFNISDFKYMHQCCFSKVNAASGERRDCRYNGETCENWKSEPQSIPNDIIYKLFPNYAEKIHQQTSSGTNSLASSSSQINLSSTSHFSMEDDPFLKQLKKCQMLAWNRACNPTDEIPKSKRNLYQRKTTNLSNFFGDSSSKFSGNKRPLQ